MLSWLRGLFSGGAEQGVEFHFETVTTQQLGELRRPVAHVKFWSPEYNEWQDHTMLIDTGADYTVLPMYMAGLLGLDMSEALVVQTNGIEGSRKISFIEGVRVRVGTMERTIPVGIAHTSRIPPLMGRHLFFETFHTEFINSKKVIFRPLNTK